jgi:hypothetical protein
VNANDALDFMGQNYSVGVWYNVISSEFDINLNVEENMKKIKSRAEYVYADINKMKQKTERRREQRLAKKEKETLAPATPQTPPKMPKNKATSQKQIKRSRK